MNIISEGLTFLVSIAATQPPFVFVITFLLFVVSIVLWICIIEILNKRTIVKKQRRSMLRVEQFYDLVKQLLNSHYLTLAKEQMGEDTYYMSLESQYYRDAVLREVVSINRAIMRDRVLENGFEKKGPDEWNNYVKLNITDEIIDMKKIIDSKYPVNGVISIPQLFSFNMSLWEKEITEEFQKLYSDLLKIAKENKLKSVIKWAVNF